MLRLIGGDIDRLHFTPTATKGPTRSTEHLHAVNPTHGDLTAHYWRDPHDHGGRPTSEQLILLEHHGQRRVAIDQRRGVSIACGAIEGLSNRGLVLGRDGSVISVDLSRRPRSVGWKCDLSY
jgi:hypothetical protein